MADFILSFLCSSFKNAAMKEIFELVHVRRSYGTVYKKSSVGVFETHDVYSALSPCVWTKSAMQHQWSRGKKVGAEAGSCNFLTYRLQLQISERGDVGAQKSNIAPKFTKLENFQPQIVYFWKKILCNFTLLPRRRQCLALITRSFSVLSGWTSDRLPVGFYLHSFLSLFFVG